MNYSPYMKNKLKHTQLQINSFCYNELLLDSELRRFSEATPPRDNIGQK